FRGVVLTCRSLPLWGRHRRGRMLQRLFPAQLDNTYRGSRIAIWLLVPIVLAKLAIGGNVMIQTRMVATNADGIPLDSYNAAGAQAVLAFFALWGLGQAILALLGVLALIRYRSMIPLIYLVLLIEQLGRKALFLAKPIAHAGT